MNVSLSDLLALLIVAVAVWKVTATVRKALRRTRDGTGGCASCGQCGSASRTGCGTDRTG
ncbi:MAG: FeoB-associated Cys-rich membrane protein [Gammaproteobacteria bacterium]|jgi:hypothetical protein|nr:FeoB-associated Cys-rich membrane protein [Gammaproteobacteria bacterium]MBU0771142.1 FeoB-associated Cys-rich membrane protein [Gammaproteobacteria bacterium]MBU0855837.1 FeoB-associated Cys-rich membrane protein [Gammaproteobacteria bacterium]MBU1849045.1 FeoB-associated Cys-rich membrane protein [Gammaproteobacteria bacterium]